MTSAKFEIISEFNRPVAAIIPGPVTGTECDTIYQLLPVDAFNQPELAKRWGVDAVLATPDWTQAQLRRKPMLKPRGYTLEIIHTIPALNK